MNYENLLKGGDLRSIGRANDVVKNVKSQRDFDSLFEGLFDDDRKVVMRTADALEKISAEKPEYLAKHKKAILKLLSTAEGIELKWHLAQMVPRMKLTTREVGIVWQCLALWAMDKSESRIVRANSVQGLYELSETRSELKRDLELMVDEVRRENIPSLNARIRKLQSKRRR